MMTHEEIQAVYEQGPDAVIALAKALSLLIAQQQAQIAQLQGRGGALEDRLATKSRHSSKPPASDGLVKQPRSLHQPAPANVRWAAGSSGRDAATGSRTRSPSTARPNGVRGLWHG